MRIAVVGSGIAGLATAWLLSRRHEVVVLEANGYLGGHTHTHALELEGQTLAVDTGFIVHNERNYPRLTAMFRELGVATRPTTMSFSVHNAGTGLEYNATSLNALFCQRGNLVSARFWRMLADLVRFYRSAPALLQADDPDLTIGQYLRQHHYSEAFCEDHLVPMACALWSAPGRRAEQIPARHLIAFMQHHQMLQLRGRPDWRVVEGGSSAYVAALTRNWKASARVNTPVLGVRRDAQGVELTLPNGRERYDQLVLACHSDQALAMLKDATDTERAVLGAIGYQRNDVALHTDPRLLPRNRKAWAAWNAYVAPGADENECTVSYCMNLLQHLPVQTPVIVTLNRTHAIDPARVIKRLRYEHPVFTEQTIAAQQRRWDIQGRRRTWYAGAYWGWGFHEDGMRSATEVASALGVDWPEIASLTQEEGTCHHPSGVGLHGLEVA